MIDERKFILGGGISSLIFRFYNRDFKIISPEVGGQFLKGTHSVSWIHDTPETRKLLRDLDLIIDPYQVQIGYYYNGFIHNSCPVNYKTKIIQKKMSDINKLETFKVPSTTLSVESNILKALHIDFNIVFDLLKKNLEWRQDKVVKIDDEKIFLESGDNFRYDEIISTIPAPIFWKLYNQPKKFKFLPATFVETWDKPVVYNDQYQMIYFAEDYLFTRLSKKEPSIYSYEFTGKIEDIKKYLPNVRILKHTVVNIGRIFPSKNNPPNTRIKFLGRISEWLYSSKIQDVIQKSIEYQNKGRKK